MCFPLIIRSGGISPLIIYMHLINITHSRLPFYFVKTFSLIENRVEIFEGLDNDQKSMEYLFNTRIGREKLFKFLEKTKIASKKWLLRSS